MKSTVEIERQIDRDLRTCGTQAVAVWTHLRFVMEFDSDRFGYLQRNGRPLPQERIARLANCSPVDGDRALQELTEIGLLSLSEETWFSPQLSRIESARSAARTRARRCREKKLGARAPDVTRGVTPASRAVMLTPPSHTLPQENTEIAAQSVPAKAGKAKKRKSSRTRSPDEHACWKKFIDVWCNVIWPGVFEGEVYDMLRGSSDDAGNRNYRAVWGILDFVGMDFDKAIAAAKSFAKTFRDSAWQFPCPLNILRRDMLKFVNHAKLFGDNHVNRRSNSAGSSGDTFTMPTLSGRAAAG